MPIKPKFYVKPYLPKIINIDNGRLQFDNDYPIISEHLLKIFFGINPHNLDIFMLENYKEIIPEGLEINFKLSKKPIIKNIIEPHRSSIRSFCFGEYHSSIFLNGFTAEMLATLVCLANKLEIQKVTRKGKNYYLRFSEIIETLEDKDYITENQKKWFNYIKDTRNDYAHHWDHLDEKRPKKLQKEITKNCFLQISNLLEDFMLFVNRENNNVNAQAKRVLDYIESLDDY